MVADRAEARILLRSVESAEASEAKVRACLSEWVTQIAQRRHINVAAVALANKTVRIAWSLIRNESDYDPEFAVG